MCYIILSAFRSRTCANGPHARSGTPERIKTGITCRKLTIVVPVAQCVCVYIAKTRRIYRPVVEWRSRARVRCCVMLNSAALARARACVDRCGCVFYLRRLADSALTCFSRQMQRRHRRARMDTYSNLSRIRRLACKCERSSSRARDARARARTCFEQVVQAGVCVCVCVHM